MAQRGGNIAARVSRLCIRDAVFFGFAVSEVTESDARAVLLRSNAEKFN